MRHMKLYLWFELLSKNDVLLNVVFWLSSLKAFLLSYFRASLYGDGFNKALRNSGQSIEYNFPQTF